MLVLLCVFVVAYFSQAMQCMVLANEQMSVLKLVPQYVSSLALATIVHFCTFLQWHTS